MGSKIKMKVTGGGWLMFGTAALAIVIGMSIYFIKKHNEADSVAGAKVSGASNSIKQNVAGSSNASEQYNKDIKVYNHQAASTAESQGTSFIATPVVQTVPTPEPVQKPVVAVAAKPVATQTQAPAPKVIEYQRPEPDRAVVDEITSLVTNIGTMNAATDTNYVRTLSPSEYEQKQIDGVNMNAAIASATTAATSGKGGSASDATVGSSAKPLMPSGTMIYGVFENRMQSGVDGPVVATLLQGKWNGDKVIGKFTRVEGQNLLAIRFTKLTDANGVAHSITGYALAPDTTLPAMETDIDRHILDRSASFAGAVFLSALSGYGQALQNSGSTMSTGLNGTVTSYPVRTSKQLTLIALGSAAQNLQPPIQALTKEIIQPNTITVKENTPFILLVTDGAESPAAPGAVAQSK